MGNNAFISCLICLALAACTVGPDFVEPQTVSPSTFLRDPNAGDLAFDENSQPDPLWWTSFQDPELDRLVERVANQNLDIKAATSRLRQSRAQRDTAAADYFPQLNGDASYTREKVSDEGVLSLVGGEGGATTGATSSSSMGIPSSASTPAFNVYQYGFDVSWEVDLWGHVRRGVEAQDANLLASQEARHAAVLSSIAEMVRDYVQLRATQETLTAVKNNVEDAKKVSRLSMARANAGLASQGDVANASAQAASAESQLPQLEQQEVSLKNAITLLVDEVPGALDQELSLPAHSPTIPRAVPIGLPSALIERRPDIRQAAAQLHAATAEIGVAKADFFPKLTLMGDGALQSLNFSNLNNWAARSYSVGPSVSLPLFEGGRLVATLDMRNEQQREAAIQYRKTVLTAFHEVDNALTAFRSEQRRRASLEDAARQNKKALDLAVERYKHGLGDFVTVLTDEQNYLSSLQQSIQSTETSAVNLVKLYKALGGGWESDTAPPP